MDSRPLQALSARKAYALHRKAALSAADLHRHEIREAGAQPHPCIPCRQPASATQVTAFQGRGIRWTAWKKSWKSWSHAVSDMRLSAWKNLLAMAMSLAMVKLSYKLQRKRSERYGWQGTNLKKSEASPSYIAVPFSICWT